jgi:hypothetical protein
MRMDAAGGDELALPRLSDFLAGMLALDAGAGHDGAVHVTALDVDLPVELELGGGDGTPVTLGAAPPTQHVVTTVMPVFHRLRLGIAAVEEAS